MNNIFKVVTEIYDATNKCYHVIDECYEYSKAVYLFFEKIQFANKFQANQKSYKVRLFKNNYLIKENHYFNNLYKVVLT